MYGAMQLNRVMLWRMRLADSTPGDQFPTPNFVPGIREIVDVRTFSFWC